MTVAPFSSNLTTANRLDQLARLFQQGQASDVMNRTLDKLFALESEESLRQIEQLQVDLAEFEQQYGMTSEQFYRRYQAGGTDDRMDYVEWASLVQMTDNLQQRLNLLAGELEA